MKNDKRIGVDEAFEILSDIARNGEGAEKFRALKMVMAVETGSVTVPDPMTGEQKVNAMAQLMRAVGQTGLQLAYRKAYPHMKKLLDNQVPRIKDDEVDLEGITLPDSLKWLYRMFPEIKRGGRPPGYPTGKGLLEKKEWCHREAIRMIKDRQQKALEEPAAESPNA